MIKIALIFPGQGAQKVGMGKEFFETSPAARQVFETADRVLNNGLSQVIFNGPQEKLTLTAYCQPAILTFSIAALRAFEADPKFQKVSVKFTAGLSLGEYSALIASQAVSFEEGLGLVERRSYFMDEACRLSSGKMAAVIGFDQGKLRDICRQTKAEIANFNSKEQIVITGEAPKVDAACEQIKELGAKAVIPLDVSGAFHSSLMRPAVEKFVPELRKVSFSDPRPAVISNVYGLPMNTSGDIRDNLAKQITSSVQWVASVEHMAKEGVSHFIEIGPGKVLKGLIRKIDTNLKVFNIETPADIQGLPFD